MARRGFFSFHYIPDNWRASQVRNIGAIEGNKPATDNDWETITKAGDDRIKRWISDQMNGTSCTIVLIGSNTAGRKWINHEIVKTWDDKKGIVGIHVHNLLDSAKRQSPRGSNPFDQVAYGNTGRKLSSVVKTYDPPYSISTDAYKYIADNLAAWIDEAIRIRTNN